MPVGVREVEGEFEAGALLKVRDGKGEYARGLSNFGAAELRKIAGKHSSQIAQILGSDRPPEVIHRDNLTLTHGQLFDSPIETSEKS